MNGRSRRQVLRGLGLLATGTALASGVHSSVEEAPLKDGMDASSVQADSEAIEWHITFGNGDYQCSQVVDLTDGVLLVGRTGGGRSATPWLAEVGSDGEPRWTTTFDTAGFTSAADAVADSDGYVALATTDEHPMNWLTSFDEEGNERRQLSLDTPENVSEETVRNHHGGVEYAGEQYTDNAHVLYSTTDGYLIGGFHGHHFPRTESTKRAAWVRAVDQNGGTRWNRLYEGRYISDIRSLGDGYLLAGGGDGDAWLQAIGPDGSPRWQHTYGGVRGEHAEVALPTTGGIFYGGSSGSMLDTHMRGMLVHTTAEGAFVWRRTLDQQYVADIRPFGDGYVITGEPQNRERAGRTPEKPVSVVDRWGRVRRTVTVSVDPGAPVGLGTFEDGDVAVGGWDNSSGIWLAKVDFSATR